MVPAVFPTLIGGLIHDINDLVAINAESLKKQAEYIRLDTS